MKINVCLTILLHLVLVPGQCDESYLGEFPDKDNDTSYRLKPQIDTSDILKVSVKKPIQINDGEDRSYIKTNMTNDGENKDKEKSIEPNDGENSDIKKSNKHNVGENNNKEKSIKPNDGENSDTKKSNKPNVGEDIDDIEKTRKRADPPGQQNFFSFFMQQQRYSKLFETMITFLNEYGFVYIVCMLYIFYRSILNTKLKNNAMHPETLSRKYKSSKKRRKKAINMKIKILFYIWMVTQPQGNDGPIITLILLTAIKGKLNAAPPKLNRMGHFQVNSPATNRCWHNLGGVRFSAQHDDNMEYGEISKMNHNKKNTYTTWKPSLFFDAYQ